MVGGLEVVQESGQAWPGGNRLAVLLAGCFQVAWLTWPIEIAPLHQCQSAQSALEHGAGGDRGGVGSSSR